MADSDEITRELVACVNCGSMYAARQWPNGDIRPIGSTECSCGSTAFEVVEETDDASSSATRAE